ncbi:superoxide dismutase, Fe-Mn family [Thermosyntropha lipolytica DSM 11003]|uniref:Superoxide dismutase n=1 Tax=Thermosyntropha lipolytica DSM 11003 TaxID=1123382 RepID=A0A1M5MJZ5_9FIRM|nr:Fe-Mn family superoxide dismutase [Thermosyntropha lipolytica]SHG77690.1 superoxide dismutase, Fe-Mn family [Thermosyntropha lipolytica DSM 11003]
MAYQLPPLPYAADALEPVISRETIEYHYGKHHQTYVNNLNNLIKDTPMENLTLEEIVLRSSGTIFNNAAQVFNHNFYWNCLTPNGKGQPSGALAEAICQQWGDFAKFKEEFSKAAISLFGSGWTWLVKDEQGKLSIENTSNADTPILRGKKPLLTFDVWEHAYYIDYRNARATYVEKLWDIINWDFVESNF